MLLAAIFPVTFLNVMKNAISIANIGLEKRVMEYKKKM